MGVLEVLGIGEENEEKRQLLIDLAKDVAAATAALVQNAKAVVQKLQGKIDEQAITIQSQESQLAWKTRMNSKAGTLQTCTKMKKNREKEITGKSYTEIWIYWSQ